MSIGDVNMSIAIQNIVLSFDSVDGIVAIQKKNFQQYFLLVVKLLTITWYLLIEV